MPLLRPQSTVPQTRSSPLSETRPMNIEALRFFLKLYELRNVSSP